MPLGATEDCRPITAPRDPALMMESRDLADSADETDAADPIDSIDAADPTDPIESTEPTEPIDSNDPRLPMHNSESSDHSDSFELAPTGTQCPASPEPRRGSGSTPSNASMRARCSANSAARAPVSGPSGSRSTHCVADNLRVRTERGSRRA